MSENSEKLVRFFNLLSFLALCENFQDKEPGYIIEQYNKFLERKFVEPPLRAAGVDPFIKEKLQGYWKQWEKVLEEL